MITTCTTCGKCYEAGSEEQANEPTRFCPPCWKHRSKPEPWDIRWLLPSPSLCQDKTPFYGTYESACDEARRIYREKRRSTCVYSQYSSVPWFVIDSQGETDRNTCGTPPRFTPHATGGVA